MSGKKKGRDPVTRVAKTEPDPESGDWIIWAAWADRITFEEIEKRTGLAERDVIRFMRKNQSPSTYRRWRQRVGGRATKHRTRFRRSAERDPIDGDH